ncbi:MAG: SpoIIE family protein phosphatase, partial [Clostridia bacterium]|nr:SpoIIE family protein phosphatase [Clostridia bacterium]
LLVLYSPVILTVFEENKGLTALGVVLSTAISLMYVLNLFRSMKAYAKTEDTLYKSLGCAFLLMFFSQISMMTMTRTYDVNSVLSHVYQFGAFILLFNVFYLHGIQRPYILLSKAKEELKCCLEELDSLVDKRTTELRCINEKLLADQEIARGMQLSMLPVSLPKNEFVSFASGYVPAEKLSGDFYNVFKIDDIRFGVCIGDVSGHGVSAAMLSIFTFQKMQSLMEETGADGMAIPSVVLKHLYASFNAANFNEDMYIVMLYGVFNSETGIFSYASGGLNTMPLRVRPDGSMQELDNDGFAICKMGDLLKPKFVNHQVLLFPGDKLVLYTDGLVDARNQNNQSYSVQGLKNTILKHYKWGAEQMTEAVVKDIKAFTQGKPADDITILTIDVLPPF